MYKLKWFIERWFNLYKSTMRMHMTTYYFDVEREGWLTKERQHRVGYSEEWVAGYHPKNTKVVNE